jgi:RNA polymerase sigma-70 factor (ECF subfamily)
MLVLYDEAATIRPADALKTDQKFPPAFETPATSGKAFRTTQMTESPYYTYDQTGNHSAIDLHGIVDRIHRGEDGGMEELYRVFSKGVRFYLCRQLGAQELEDKVHDTFLIVVQAIQRGDLREPDRLMGFIRTIVRRQVAAHIDTAVHNRRELAEVETGTSLPDSAIDPEETAIARQKADLMETILSGLSTKDREVLTRFYLEEQPQEQICKEMRLSETQFRLLKSRAKTRFGELGRKRLLRRPIRAFFVRDSLSA